MGSVVGSVTLSPGLLAQEGYACRLAWDPRGASAAAARGDSVIIVDGLSFSTTAVTAVQHGVVFFPYGSEEAREVAVREDVRHAARLDLYDAVPVLRGNRLVAETAAG